RVDIAFNNAGISPPEDDSILTTGLDAWRRVQEINLTSVYLCCKHVLPHMQRAGRASIINTASFVAVLGAATSQISYTASKGGVPGAPAGPTLLSKGYERPGLSEAMPAPLPAGEPPAGAPVIGISACSERARWSAWRLDAVVLPQAYAAQVAAAGGVPVLLPP